jgi:hypothetical protein
MSRCVFFQTQSTHDAATTRFRARRDIRECIVGGRPAMPKLSQNVASLRAEARLLTTAGLILLAIGFPLTLSLVMLAMSPDGLSPILPLAAGGPPLLLGYLACHYASARLSKAKALESQAS